MMDNMYKNQLSDFFNRTYESAVEKQIIIGEFLSIKDEVIGYVKEIIEIPICSFIDYISENCKRLPIEASDVFQFSDFCDATEIMCSKLCRNNTGLKFKEIAELLFNDDIQRSDCALNKYGENHIKTAELLGLAFKDASKKYYLGAIGYAFNELGEKNKERLLVRLIIRNKLISQLILAALQGQFDMEAFLYDLSKSTYIRRKTNIKRIINVINNSDEFDFSYITKNIIY